jgi:hypothetical protein
MTTKNDISGWTLNGEKTAPTKLLAGVLPPRGVHVLTGPDAAINLSIAASRRSRILETGPIEFQPISAPVS